MLTVYKLPGSVENVCEIESKSVPVAPKYAPKFPVCAAELLTPKSLPLEAAVVVQPVKSPVSNPPLVRRSVELALPANIRTAAELIKVAISLFMSADREFAIRKGQAKKEWKTALDIAVNARAAEG